MSSSSLLSFLLDGYTPSIILASIAVILVCIQRLSLQLDPQEPPILKPKIPYIGHIIGLVRNHGAFYDHVNIPNPMPIATLPMLNGKMYMITSPTLINAAMRHKDLSFAPFMLAFAQRMLGVSDETMVPVRSPEFVPEFVKEIHGAMLGEHLYKMNADALNNVADTLNEMNGVFEVDSLYIWLRGVLTMATCNALLGSHNPMIADPSLVDSLWDFEAGMMNLLLNIAPSILAPKAYQGRAKLQAAMIPYYTNEYDLLPDVSKMCKVRAAICRRHGIPPDDIGRFEIALLHVSTANAIPTMFWHLVFLATDQEIVKEIREEVESIIAMKVKDGKRIAALDITKFESHCPLLCCSYREAMRLCNAQVGARRAMEDVRLSDGKNSYLLKKGTDVQMPTGIAHRSTGPWGQDASSFNPRRPMNLRVEKDREQKRSFIPFGGGKHLCPGRDFAKAEILGTVSSLLVGWDVQSADGGMIAVPELQRPRMGEGVAKPAGKGLKMGARFVRRQEWEDVKWEFVC